MAYVAFAGLAIVGDDREAVEAGREVAVDSSDGLFRAHIGLAATEIVDEDGAARFVARMQALGLRVGKSKLIRERCGLDPRHPGNIERMIEEGRS